MPRKIKYPYEFDKKKRVLAKKYRRGRLWSFLINSIAIEIAALSIILLSGFNAALRDAFPFAWYSQAILAFTAIFFILAAVYFPSSFYFAYVYERKYKLSSQTPSRWFRDYIKFLFIAYITAVPAVVFLYFVLPLPNWWAYALAGFLIANIFFDYIYPIVITPMFYKLYPYKNKLHMKKIIEIIKNAGVSDIKNVYVANESQRSVKANAFFAGFGRTKHVLLFDTLTDNFTQAEVETVIGHELGHYVNKDIWRGVFANFLRMIPVLLIIDFVLRSTGLFGITAINDIAALPLIMLSYHVLGLLSMPFMNAYSRKIEKEADIFALDSVKKPDAQISTEKRLADMALGDLNPHPLVEKWLYTHPKVLDRIRFCEDWKKGILKKRN